MFHRVKELPMSFSGVSRHALHRRVIPTTSPLGSGGTYLARLKQEDLGIMRPSPAVAVLVPHGKVPPAFTHI